MRTLPLTPSRTSEGFVSVGMVEFDPEVLAYCDRGEEQGRLTERPSLSG